MEYVDVQFTHTTPKGERYRVFRNGEVLVKSSRVPFCDAARALQELGISGEFACRRDGQVYGVGDIDKMARWTVNENEKHGPGPGFSSGFRCCVTRDGWRS